MKWTRSSAAISSFAFSKTGFVSHGSMSRTFPLDVTILKAACPYQASCVSFMQSRNQKELPEQELLDAAERQMMNDEITVRHLSLIRHSTFGIRHFSYVSPNEPRARSPASQRERSAYGGASRDERRRNHRAAYHGARHWTLDGRDASSFRSWSSGCLAGR